MINFFSKEYSTAEYKQQLKAKGLAWFLSICVTTIGLLAILSYSQTKVTLSFKVMIAHIFIYLTSLVFLKFKRYEVAAFLIAFIGPFIQFIRILIDSYPVPVYGFCHWYHAVHFGIDYPAAGQ
jgi:cobalamin biosynthesis protein CobD/CbiB